MIEHELSAFSNCPLWQKYVSIDYGRAVPESGYKGFKTFLKDVTGADRVEGRSSEVFTLYFNNEEKYIWFILKWG